MCNHENSMVSKLRDLKYWNDPKELVHCPFWCTNALDFILWNLSQFFYSSYCAKVVGQGQQDLQTSLLYHKILVPLTTSLSSYQQTQTKKKQPWARFIPLFGGLHVLDYWMRSLSPPLTNFLYISLHIIMAYWTGVVCLKGTFSNSPCPPRLRVTECRLSSVSSSPAAWLEWVAASWPPASRWRVAPSCLNQQ